MMSRALSARRLLVLLLMGLVALVPATAGAATFPDTIRLPDGWQPEGIAAGRGTSLYVGSIPTGAIWKGDARTGQGDVLVPGRPGERNAIGIKVDRRNRLFVAGGPTGKAFVYDAATGADLASYQLAPADTAVTFINDVVVTHRAAFFTDSRNQITTDVDLNGIVAARGGQTLLSVQSNSGKLFKINPRSGEAREVDLGETLLLNGDGLLLAGRLLFVVQNRLNQIAVVKLSGSLDEGRLVATIRDNDFDVPTTIAFQAGRLWAVNARFGTTDPQPARYDIVRVG
jgi:hypothetical protein